MRYFVFAGASRYPRGGAMDFRRAYEVLDDAKDGARYHLGRGDVEWAHVAELMPNGTMPVVWSISVE